MTTKFYEHFPISIKSNLDDNRYISGCELLMSHLWRIDYEIFGNDAWKNKNQYFWGLNEFLSGLILLEIPEVKMIVANNENFDDEKFLFNYPKLHVIKNDVKKLFHERTSFERFMRDCLDFLKEKYPEENIQEFVQF